MIVRPNFTKLDMISNKRLWCVWFSVYNTQKSEALNANFFANVVFCRDFYLTPLCKRYTKPTLNLTNTCVNYFPLTKTLA